MLKIQYNCSNYQACKSNSSINKKNKQICFTGRQLERFSQVEKMAPETQKLAEFTVKKFIIQKNVIKSNIQNYLRELKNISAKNNIQIGYSAKLQNGINDSNIRIVSKNGKVSITNGEHDTYLLSQKPDNIEIFIALKDGEIGVSKRNNVLLCNKDLNMTVQIWLKDLLEMR